MTETNSERHDRLMLPFPENLLLELNASPYGNASIPLTSMILSAEELEFGLSNLQKRETEFLMMRFKERLTYKAIGERMGVSAARARQIVFQDLTKIRWCLKKKRAEERK